VKAKPIYALVLVATLSGCGKAPPKPPPESPEKPLELILPAPLPAVPVSTPAPAKTPDPPAPAKPPDGVYWLLNPVSIESDTGIATLRPGTAVKRLRPGIYLTPQGETAIADSNVTGDPQTARIARDSYVASLAQPRVETIAPDPLSVATVPVRPNATPAIAKRLPTPQPSNALGASHTRTKDGWLWQKNNSGEWQRVKRLGK